MKHNTGAMCHIHVVAAIPTLRCMDHKLFRGLFGFQGGVSCSIFPVRKSLKGVPTAASVLTLRVRHITSGMRVLLEGSSRQNSRIFQWPIILEEGWRHMFRLELEVKAQESPDHRPSQHAEGLFS